MWLINTETLELQEFQDDRKVPPYAILSHTWEKDEVSFQELKGQFQVQHKAGFHKIAQTCAVARHEGLKFAWVDTCCIDKTSSSELSEAINTMFKWYHQAEVCYVYLSDFATSANDAADLLVDERLRQSFSESRWFKRGWTLQELLASRKVRFYSSLWSPIAALEAVTDLVSSVTGVQHDVLTGMTPLYSMSIAQRLSWAAGRQTTRLEDEAYCLLGVLGVNMPLLYGEGARAFQRLQEEVIRSSTDHSIFAWPRRGDGHDTDLLARSPHCFRPCSKIYSTPDFLQGSSYDMTNRGLRITLPVLAEPVVDSLESYLEQEGAQYALLNCRDIRMPDKTMALRVFPESTQESTSSEMPVEYCKYGEIDYISPLWALSAPRRTIMILRSAKTAPIMNRQGVRPGVIVTLQGVPAASSGALATGDRYQGLLGLDLQSAMSAQPLTGIKPPSRWSIDLIGIQSASHWALDGKLVFGYAAADAPLVGAMRLRCSISGLKLYKERNFNVGVKYHGEATLLPVLTVTRAADFDLDEHLSMLTPDMVGNDAPQASPDTLSSGCLRLDIPIDIDTNLRVELGSASTTMALGSCLRMHVSLQGQDYPAELFGTSPLAFAWTIKYSKATCGICGRSIRGMDLRYKCLGCVVFDFCRSCAESKAKDHPHPHPGHKLRPVF